MFGIFRIKMINNFGTSICQPNITAVCKEISKNIGDRDNHVRTAALNWFVAVFLVHGDAVFSLAGNIPEKDMDLLKKCLKKASKNLVVPILPTTRPTKKMIVYPVQQVPQAEDIVDNKHNSNTTFNVPQVSNHEYGLQKKLNDSPSRSSNNLSCQTGSISYTIDHSPKFEIKSRLKKYVIDKPCKVRFALDEIFIQELDSIVITKPQLVKLIEYNWPLDNDEVNFKQILDESRSLLGNILFKPCLSVSPFRNTIIAPLVSVKHIQQLINQVRSQNINTYNTAMTSLIEMLLIPKMRSKFLEEDKVIPLFDAIIKQFDNILSGSHDTDDIVRYKKLLDLCLILNKHQEFMLVLNEQIVYDLLSRLLYSISVSDIYDHHIRKCQKIIINVLEQSAHNPVTCAPLAMLYDTVQFPQHFSTYYKKSLKKYLWRIVQKMPVWCDELCYNLVLGRIHKFIKKFDSKYWNEQPSVIPLKILQTVIHTLVQLRSDEVLKCLASLEFPNDSEMVVYTHKILKELNSKARTESNRY